MRRQRLGIKFALLGGGTRRIENFHNAKLSPNARHLRKKPQPRGRNDVYRSNFAFHKAFNIVPALKSTTHHNFLYILDNKIQEIVRVYCLVIIQNDLILISCVLFPAHCEHNSL